MNFRLDLCIYMDNSLVVFLEKFSFTSSIFVKDAKKKKKKKTFLKINGFGIKYFIKSKYRRIQSGLAILKYIKHLIFFQTIDFFIFFFQKSRFSEIFENHQ